MKTIHHVLDIDAGVPAAWAALTTGTGLAGWWSPQVSIEETRGGPRVSFVFGGDFNPVMQVTAAEQGRRLVWQCTAGHDNWQDNTFTFELAGLPDGRTRLRFTQDYATELSDDDYGIYNFNWGYYLESLRLLLTTGTGRPYQPQAAWPARPWPPTPAAVVLAYLGAWQDRDFPAMRRLVADDLRFTGPLDTFDRADAHHAAIKALTGLVDHIDIGRVWSEGPEVLAWYTLHTTIAKPAAVAEWYQVDDGRITAITVVFDARPFTALTAAAPEPET
ncbi:MAG TPA: nuclear transport factor 2 family protein [Streptosporangiaceae bacterium]|nr:nuclear transport factor 2 family protein [Streptosporangiaceae bacterium]